MAQIIVKCPNCSKSILANTGSGYSSETIMAQEKKCSGCLKDLKITIKLVAEVIEPETSHKKK